MRGRGCCGGCAFCAVPGRTDEAHGHLNSGNPPHHPIPPPLHPAAPPHRPIPPRRPACSQTHHCSGWYYHKEYKAWLTRAPNTEPVQKTDRCACMLCTFGFHVVAGPLLQPTRFCLCSRTSLHPAWLRLSVQPRLTSHHPAWPHSCFHVFHSCAGLSAAPSSCLTPIRGRWCARTTLW